MDDMKNDVSRQDGHDDATQQGNPFWQHQGFPSGGAQFGGIPGGWGFWPYGGFPGGMCGKGQGDMRMGYETPSDGAKCWEMSESPFPSDSLMGLLLQSNNGLFARLYTSQEVETAVFSGLTDEERKTLKEILTKLLASWSDQGQA